MPKKPGKSAPKKPVAKTAKTQSSAVQRAPRRLKPPAYKPFRFKQGYKHPVKLPSVFKLTKLAWQLAWQNKKVLLIITLVYGLLNLLLVRGLSGGADLNSLKDTFDSAFGGNWGALASGAGVFVTLLGSSGNSTSDTSGAYQTFLGLVASLAVIWALRQLMVGMGFRARDAYYKGMYPLIPFILVILVIGLQLLPMLIGLTIYSLVVTNSIAVGAAQLVWAVLAFLLALWSLYMVTASVFALYIVTLPDMTPVKALRSARRLVRYRRWVVMRKILWLPLLMLLLAAVIMIPVIIVATALAQWVFFILSMLALLAAHTYMYTLYRELLNE